MGDSGMSNEVSDSLREYNPGYATFDQMDTMLDGWAIPMHIGTISRGHIAQPELGGPSTGYLAPMQTSMRMTCMPLNSLLKVSSALLSMGNGKISLVLMMLSSHMAQTSHSSTSRLQGQKLVRRCLVGSSWISNWRTWRLAATLLSTFIQSLITTKLNRSTPS